MILTAFVCCYFAFGKQVVETGGYIGGTMLNELDDFTIYCFTLFLLPFGLGASFCATLSKNKTKLSELFITLIYVAVWLLAVTWAAEGCAVNWGDSWTTLEVVFTFVVSNFLYGLPLLVSGLFLNLLLQQQLNIRLPKV